MSSPADPFSILSKNAQAPGYRKPAPKPKVQRYRKGKGPEMEEQDDDDNDDIYTITHMTIDNNDQASVADTELTTSKAEEDEIRERLNKRRQARRTVIVEENTAKEEEPPKVQEKPKQKQIEMEEEEDEEVDNAARRRALLKEKLLEQEKLNEAENQFEGMEEEEEMEEEEDEAEEEGGIISMLKPVFVSKHERETNDKKIEEEIALKEEENRLKEKRKLESKMLFLEAVRKDEEAEKDDDNLSHGQMPDDDDTFDEADQYVQWKIRELKRIKREREERSKRDKDKAEIERRRRLTDAERAHENKVLGSDSTQRPEKTQLKFMQKYYHKGGFYQDSDDPIFKRDYNLAVGEDLWDKSNLPAILQKRRGQFGMRGATKYTHLTDQDTTNFDPQYRVDENIQDKTKNKTGGYKGKDALDRPTTKKR